MSDSPSITVSASDTTAQSLKNILKSIPNQEVVESHLGQWEYPGRITRIPSNTITMQPDPRTGKPIQHIL